MPRQRTGTLVLRKGVWHARVTVDRDGKPVREWYTLDTSDRDLALRRLARLVKELSAGNSVSAATAIASQPDTVAQYLDGLGDRLSDGDRANLRLHCLPALGPMALSAVRTSHIKAVRDAKIAECHKRGTLGKILGAMRRLFAAAIEDELVEQNPAADVRLPKLRGEAREVAKQRTILTDEEVARFFDCPKVDLELRLMSLVARCEGGMRTSDVNRWDWSMLDREAFAECYVLRSKTATPQQLDVPEVLRPHLRTWWEKHGRPAAGPVFPCRRGANAGSFKATRGISYAKRLRKGLQKAGIKRHACAEPDKPMKSSAPCCTNFKADPLYFETTTTLPVDFHSFRRAFNTALASAGVNVQKAMHLAGHADAKTHMRYVMQAPEMRVIPTAALPRLTVTNGDESSQRTADHGGSEERADEVPEGANQRKDSLFDDRHPPPEPKASGSNPLWRARDRGGSRCRSRLPTPTVTHGTRRAENE